MISRWIGAVVLMAATLAAGCGGPQARILYMSGGPDETVRYDLAVYQLAKGAKVQAILFRKTAAPIGDADPDFEYVFFELPEKETFGWIKDDHVPAYRWVRQGGRDRVWRGATGRVTESSGDNKEHLHLVFRVTMEPAAGTPGGPYELSGNVKFTEDMVMTTGLMNRYSDWLRTILGEKPKPAQSLVPGK